MIGIIGGVGPLAGLDIMAKIIEETKAATDQDHLPVLLSSQPHRITDRTDYLLGKATENPAYAIVELILALEKAGATVVAIPSNTVHAPRIFDVIKKGLADAQSQVRLLHLIEETAAYVAATYGQIPIAVLSSTVTKNTSIYRNALTQHGIAMLEPDEQLQEKVQDCIYDETYGIKATSYPVSNRARQELIQAIAELKKEGAKAVVLGCRALHLAIPEKENDGLPNIDPTRILARALIHAIDPSKLR